MNRRSALQAGGTALLTVVAGCLNDGFGPSGTPGEGADSATGDGEATETTTPANDGKTPGEETSDGDSDDEDSGGWTSDIDGEMRTVANGSVFGIRNRFNSDGSVFALEAETGDRQWTYGQSYEYEWFASLAVADAVYLGRVTDEVGGSGIAYAVEFDGSERWKVPTTGVLGMEVGETRVYTEHAFGVRAFDRTNGENRWEYDLAETRGWTDGPGSPQITLASGTVYVAGEELLAFDPGDHSLSWTYGDQHTYVRLGGVRDNLAIVDTDRGIAGVIDGESRWSVEATESGPDLWGLASGRVVARADGGFRAFDPETGDEQWRSEPLGEAATRQPIDDQRDRTVFADDTMYVVRGSDLYALDLAEGTRLWHSAVGEETPIALEERGSSHAVYVHDGTDLLRLDGAGEETWSVSLDGEVSEIIAEKNVFVETESGIEAFDPP